MNRHEYMERRTEFVLRGQELGQARLCDLDVIAIRSAARQRASLLAHIHANLTNAAIAQQFGVHVRTVEKVIARESWSHLP